MAKPLAVSRKLEAGITPANGDEGGSSDSAHLSEDQLHLSPNREIIQEFLDEHGIDADARVREPRFSRLALEAAIDRIGLDKGFVLEAAQTIEDYGTVGLDVSGIHVGNYGRTFGVPTVSLALYDVDREGIRSAKSALSDRWLRVPAQAGVQAYRPDEQRRMHVRLSPYLGRVPAPIELQEQTGFSTYFHDHSLEDRLATQHALLRTGNDSRALAFLEAAVAPLIDDEDISILTLGQYGLCSPESIRREKGTVHLDIMCGSNGATSEYSFLVPSPNGHIFNLAVHTDRDTDAQRIAKTVQSSAEATEKALTDYLAA